MEISREGQLRIEQGLNKLRYGYSINVQRLNSWAGLLVQGSCHEDVAYGTGASVDSLVKTPAQWRGELGVKATYDEITEALRANVLSLIERYFERVLSIVIAELEPYSLLASEFNSQLGKIGTFLAGQCQNLLQEADSTLSTGFSAMPPPIAVEVLLDQEIDRRRWRDYAGDLFGVVQTLSAEKAELAHGLSVAADPTRSGGAATWDAIEISFLSDERVQIHNGPAIETRNYSELGFADRRNGKPNQAWLTLRRLAEVRGTIRDGATTGREWPKVEKRVQEIRKALRHHFGISTDPVPFVEGTGYQSCFKISCSPSFDT